MKTPKLILAAVFFLATILTALTLRAGDLDDGISTYIDESIEADSELGEPSVNLNFIVLDAIAKAKINQDNKNMNFNDGSGDNNVNSVVCEPGADCSGDIININIDDK